MARNDSPIEQLRWAITLRCELPEAPTNEQLLAIIERVASLWSSQGGPSDEAWRQIVYEIVRPTGRMKRAGLDYADLNALVLQIAAQAKKQGGA